MNRPSSSSSLELTLPTADCAGCRRAVLEELTRLEGVAHVEMDAGSGNTCITFHSDVIDVATIVARLTEAGYPPVADVHDADASTSSPRWRGDRQ